MLGTMRRGLPGPAFPCDSTWFTVAVPDLALRVHVNATSKDLGALGGECVANN